MRPVLISLALAGLASLNAARAADLWPPNLASPVPVASWQGFYAGSIYGVGFGEFRSSQAASNHFTGFGETAGALIGYNWESNNFVYGLEGDLTLDSISGKDPGVAPGLPATGLDMLYTSHVRGRLGYDLGQFLPFVAAGAAFNDSYQYDTPLNQYGERRASAGLSLGLGVDWRVNAPFLGPMVVRGEYLHDAYPGETYNLLGGPVRTQISNNLLRVALIVQPGEVGAAWGPSVDPASWSGGYAGVLGGGLWAQPRTQLGGASTTYTASGPMVGLFAGRNFMFGSWMLGFEGSTSLADVTGAGPQPLAPATTFRSYDEADLRGRVGYAMGAFMPFLAGGLDLSQSEQVDLNTGSERGAVPSAGITLGGGVDFMMNERWSTRLEYLYDAGFTNSNTRLDGRSYAQTRNAQSVRVGLAYHFH